MSALALSEAVLMLACLGVAGAWARQAAWHASLPLLLAGWTLIAAAAGLGALRFGAGWDGLQSAHRAVSTLAAGLGLPALAIGVGVALWMPEARPATGLAGLLGLTVIHAGAHAVEIARLVGALIVAVAAVGTMAWATRRARARAAAALALAAVLAAGLLGGQAAGSERQLVALHCALAFLQLAWFAVLYRTAVRR